MFLLVNRNKIFMRDNLVRCQKLKIYTDRYIESGHLYSVLWIKQGKDFPGCTSGKQPSCHCRRCKRCGCDPWVTKIPWRRAWQLTLVFLPWESHGQRSLAGYSPWDPKSGIWQKRLSIHSSSTAQCLGKNKRPRATLCPVIYFSDLRG